MSECIPTFSISQERRGQVDDIGIVVIISNKENLGVYQRKKIETAKTTIEVI